MLSRVFVVVVSCTLGLAAALPSCTPAEISGGGGGGDGNGGGDSCIDGQLFSISHMQSSLGYLASEKLSGRKTGTPGGQLAREFIVEQFSCLGLEPGIDNSFEQLFTNRAGTETANIIGIIPGSDPSVASEIIVVSAHYDHLGKINGEFYLGANDNASGVSGLLEVAKAIKQSATMPKRTIAFVAFGSEETLTSAPYVEGSDYYVKNAPTQLPIEQVVYNINLDMIGTHSLENAVWALGSFSGTPARLVLDQKIGNYPALNVELGDFAETGDSDFYPFCLAGIPFVYFWTEDSACLHESCDTVDRIDFSSASQIAQLIFDLVVTLGNSSADLLGERTAIRCNDPNE